MSIEDRIEELAQQIHEVLYVWIEPVADGQFHRYAAPGKAFSNTAIWVKVSPDARYAKFGNFITGESHTWSASGVSRRSSIEAVRTYPTTLNKEELEAQHLRAARSAQAFLKTQDIAPANNLYALQKGITPFDALGDRLHLYIPLRDTHDRILNYQTIYADLNKRFQKGARIKGLFARIGEYTNASRIYICEGYATGATIHDLTGAPVACAMTANNLMPVTQELLAALPYAELVIAADNDHRTKGNPGLTKAVQIAERFGLKYVAPEAPCKASWCSCTDFNDIERCTTLKLEKLEAEDE
ncbi:MAG: toprim domain-containing protein [Methylocystaceae bacterium]|nr:toprim domain-containing protein [Methylocystaceae bacterium]